MLRPALFVLPPVDSPRAEPPAFARDAGCARVEAPFREGVAALCLEPGEVVLCARLPALPDLASVPLHWEIARDATMRTRERYGLRAVQPGEAVRIPLHALEKGRDYWFRLWAGGQWSHTGHFQSGAPRRPDLSLAASPVRATRPVERVALRA